jgi:hypothetical protein
MFLSTSGNRPLTSTPRQFSSAREAGIWPERTFPHRHGRDYTFDSILAFVAVLAVEINAELVVFSFTWSLSTGESAHNPAQKLRWRVSLPSQPTAVKVDQGDRSGFGSNSAMAGLYVSHYDDKQNTKEKRLHAVYGSTPDQFSPSSRRLPKSPRQKTFRFSWCARKPRERGLLGHLHSSLWLTSTRLGSTPHRSRDMGSTNVFRTRTGHEGAWSRNHAVDCRLYVNPRLE